VLEILTAAVVTAAVEHRDCVGQVVLHILARSAILIVLHGRVAEQIAHVAHVGSTIVVGVALRHRARVHLAPRTVGLHCEGDDVLVPVLLSVTLDLEQVAFGGDDAVVTHVVRVNPASAVGSGSGTGLDFGHDVFTAVCEVNRHARHRVGPSIRAGAS